MTQSPDITSFNLDDFLTKVRTDFAAVSNDSELDETRRSYLGKDGTIKLLLKQLKQVPPESKATVAAGLNEAKKVAEELTEATKGELASRSLQAALSGTFIDLSLPETGAGFGGVHPIRLLERKIDALLAPFGFRIVEGPEVETNYYCFDALNIPEHHPARDMQDTFYTENGHVLRTHTTSVQARELERSSKEKNGGLPVKIISRGRVYRNETEDTSHQSMFHQYELVWVEAGLRLSDLMGILSYLLKGLYGKNRKVRFVPKFYPYTEPSLGAQINCTICNAKGCGSCGGSGWVTILGSGMIHENVLREFGYDPHAVSGIAFGLGTARLAAQFYGADHLKMLYDNDLRSREG